MVDEILQCEGRVESGDDAGGATLMPRDEFSARTRENLAKRVAYVCARPGCGRLTVGPHANPDKSLQTGRACHIHGAAPSGPRYDPNQSTKERTSIENGIWLCAICSDVVDKDPDSYPAALLMHWKSEAEAKTLDSLLKGRSAGDVSTAHPTAADKIAAAKLLDDAFDTLAGGELSDRLNWRRVDRRSLEFTRRAIRDAEALDPSSPMIPLMKAVCLLATGFPERALEILNGATTSKRIEVAQFKSRCFADLGRLAEARAVLEAIVDEPGVPPAVRYNIGSAFLQEGRSGDAEPWLRAAISQDPTYGEAYELLARIARDRGDMELAAQHSAEAFRLLPNDSQAAHDYALTLLMLERWDDAERVLASVDEALGRQPDFLCLKAQLTATRGRTDEAEAMLRAALTTDPKHPVALHNLGYVQLMQGRFDEAQTSFERAKSAGYPEEDDIPGRIAALRGKWVSRKR